MDATSSERAALWGFSEGGALTSLFAATYPDRTAMLILWGSIARFSMAPDFPHGITPEVSDYQLRLVEEEWGTGITAMLFGPSVANDQQFINWCARNERLSASPGAMEQLIRLNSEIDVRYIFPAIQVPTLVMHRTGDLVVDVEQGHWLAEHIQGAKYVELPGDDHLAWIGDAEAAIGEVEEFLTGQRAAPDADRVLATVLFTDIVESARRLEALGDRRWRYLLDEHYTQVRRLLDRFKGVEIDTAGDGFFATFDGPARAIRCACAIRDAVREIGLEIRAGLHTGEVERRGSAITGLAVHIGARVAALAQASEVLVTGTVQVLVLGSGISFTDRGLHDLKGVPGQWQLFAVEGLSGTT
jgi:class 3 adenylate cyclase